MGVFCITGEINELPNILCENEDIVRMAWGTYNLGFVGSGIVVATNKRVLFVRKHVFDTQIEDFAYDKISSIQCNKGICMGSLIIYSVGNKAVIKLPNKTEAQFFADYIRSKIFRDSVPTLTQEQDSFNNDIVSQLERLAKLKEQGILTDEEFVQQKTKILNN